MNEEAAKALAAAPTDSTPEKPLRRVRYRGRNPRHFREKYKEHQPARYGDDVAKVIAGGKTPAERTGPSWWPRFEDDLLSLKGSDVVCCDLNDAPAGISIRRCRGTPLAALVPGQGGRSNRLCVGHWLDTESQQTSPRRLHSKRVADLCAHLVAFPPCRRHKTNRCMS